MKFSHLLLTALIAAAVAYGAHHMLPSAAADSRESTYERVMRTRELRCAYVIYPPLFAKDVNTGQFSGVMYDMVEALGKQMGIKIIWAEEVGTDNAFAGIATGRYDAICPGFWINPERAAVANFAKPFYYQGVFAFGRADETRFAAGPQAMNRPDIRFVILEGEMSQIIAREDYPKAQAILLPGLSGAPSRLIDVVSGKGDVALHEMSVFEQYNAANPGKAKPLFKDALRISGAAIAFPKDDFDLIHMINTNIDVMVNTGIVDRILDKYDPEGREYLRLATPYKLPE
ncbi:MAG: substrate-binding periplasmic protein [Bdellovibrionales bacterium]